VLSSLVFDTVNGVLVVEQSVTQARVPAVDRAVRILWTLAERGERSLSELSRALGVSKSTLSALLATLEQHALVERDAASRRFRLGPGVANLAMSAAAAPVDVRDAARPQLERLAELSGETAILHLPSGDGTVIAERVEPMHQLKVVAPLGHRLPAFAGSVAKVLLAALPEEQAEAIVRTRSLPVFTPRSIVDPDEYLEQVARARRRGYAVENQEYLVGVRAVTAPVLDRDGEAIGTLSVVGVGARIAGRMRELAHAVVSAAAETSRQVAATSGASPTEEQWHPRR
jgi:DNA-binding IclR family transcriptional regulator